MEPFVAQLLRLLLDADRRRDGGLVTTLRAYLAAALRVALWAHQHHR